MHVFVATTCTTTYQASCYIRKCGGDGGVVDFGGVQVTATPTCGRRHDQAQNAPRRNIGEHPFLTRQL